MDLTVIKHKALRLYRELRKKGIHPAVIILFGSYAKGTSHEQSDIDIAVVSSDFGRDRFSEGVLVNEIASKIDSRMEVIPVSLEKYFEKESIIPIIHEIHKTGIVLF